MLLAHIMVLLVVQEILQEMLAQVLMRLVDNVLMVSEV